MKYEYQSAADWLGQLGFWCIVIAVVFGLIAMVWGGE